MPVTFPPAAAVPPPELDAVLFFARACDDTQFVVAGMRRRMRTPLFTSVAREERTTKPDVEDVEAVLAALLTVKLEETYPVVMGDPPLSSS